MQGAGEAILEEATGSNAEEHNTVRLPTTSENGEHNKNVVETPSS